MGKIKIGIDAWYLARPYSSIGKMLKNTLRYFSEFMDKYNAEIVLFGNDNPYIKSYSHQFKIVIIPTQNTMKFYWYLTKLAKKENLDIFFFPFDIAPFYSYKYVVMVHDLRFAHIISSIKDLVFSFMVKRAVEKANKIITPSYFTKKEIIARYRVNAKRIQTIHLGIDPIFKRIPPEEAMSKVTNLSILTPKVLEKGFILHVGRIRPKYKNISTLLRAYIKYKNEINMYLVIVSSDIPSSEDRKIIDKHKDYIIYLRNIPDEILVLLYNLSDFCIYPSIYEGFPVSLLEALGCEKPIIASNILPHREALGDAGLFFNPFSIEELCEAMIKLSIDYSLKSRLSTKAGERAKIFSWESFSDKLLKTLISAIEEG